MAAVANLPDSTNNATSTAVVAMTSLNDMRAAAGPRDTKGLSDDYLTKFLETDLRLSEAIDAAYKIWKGLDASETYKRSEREYIAGLFKGYQHLYPEDTRQPYVPLAARGPWMVSMHGAVVHDSGGYGMLGLGHNPKVLLDAMREEAVMANHMTPCIDHGKFIGALHAEIGRSRPECPYESFICLNSGSEANEMVLRICDLNTGRVAGSRKVHNLVAKGAFHGRTLSAALLTDTSRESYAQNKAYLITKLQDNSGMNYVLNTEPNNIEELKHWFERCEKENCFIQAVYLEGVMGEGNPGVKLSPEFYMAARELTLKHASALCIDSVQAGIRTTGNLSICDFPGFENLPPPDFEVFAKALNGGQFPLSLVALSPRAASWYRHGVYGNTMTGNPRAIRVATAMLKQLTPTLRKNIVDMGDYVVQRYTDLMNDELRGIIIMVTGTGLLYQVKLDPKFVVTAMDGVEMSLRRLGINVIHGGTNALRFTPNFDITKEEIDMQVSHVRQVILDKLESNPSNLSKL